MIRQTPEGQIAEFYDANLWRDLDSKLRRMRVDQLERIATQHVSFDQMRYQQGILRGFDLVREMANEIMRPKLDGEET